MPGLSVAGTLIVCSSTDGQTTRICQRMQQVLQAQGHAVQLVMIEDAQGLDPGGFGCVVVGARIRYGRHDDRVMAYVRRHAQALQSMPSAFFSVNIVARKPQKNTSETNPYVRKFLRQSPWQPRLVGVFAGKLDYPRYRPLDRLVIRFIMWLTDGPTRPDTVCEFTDWTQVEAFARRVSTLSL